MNKKELWLRIKNYHFNHIVPANLWEKFMKVMVVPTLLQNHLQIKFLEKSDGGSGCSSYYGGGN